MEVGSSPRNRAETSKKTSFWHPFVRTYIGSPSTRFRPHGSLRILGNGHLSCNQGARSQLHTGKRTYTLLFCHGVRARSSRATVITRVTRPHYGHAPSFFPWSLRAGKQPYRHSLSCQPKGQPHYATYGAATRAHLLSTERTAPTLNNLDRNLHASQDVTDKNDTCDRTVLINRRNLNRRPASIASRFHFSRPFTVAGN